jgi:hypothetical protein
VTTESGVPLADGGDQPPAQATTTDPPASPNPPPPEDPTRPDTPGREAAKYRVRLREVEAERDQITAQLTTYQRAAVEQLAAERLAVGADVFDVARAELADLLDEQGQVNPEAVAAAVDALLVSRPGLGRDAVGRLPAGFPDLGQGARSRDESGGTSWTDVIRPG